MVESCVRAGPGGVVGEDGGPRWCGRGRGLPSPRKVTVPPSACFFTVVCALSVWTCSKWLLESVLWGPLTQPAAPLPVTRLGLGAFCAEGPRAAC